MIEVEVKLKIENIDALKLKLQNIGFTQCEIIKEIDIYFDNRSGDIRLNDSALRIRETINETDNTRFCQLNYKGKKFDNKSMTRLEYETEVADASATEKILNGLGYYSVEPKVIKIRHAYKSSQMNACLDQVDGLGDYLELEMIVENESERGTAFDCIEETLTKLGYNLEDTTTVSYLSALQSQLDNQTCPR